jgi:hypothetical protein
LVPASTSTAEARDREPVERRIVFAHLMASAADPSHREMDG